MIRVDHDALITIRQYLDDTMYALVDFRVGFEAPISPTGFPRYEVLERVVERLDPAHRTVCRLLRMGQPAPHDDVEKAMPRRVLDAFSATGLMERGDDGHWRTPSLLLVPVDGVLVFASVPPSYPTATRPCSVWLDLSTYVVARALPGSLAGERVLDICCGTGVQAILCAVRGAQAVTGLDVSDDAVRVAGLNAAFNFVADRVTFRQSDKLAALQAGEQFDFILCNTPYAPVTGGADEPRTLDEVGNSVLLAMLDELPAHLTGRGRGIVAAWRSVGTGASTLQRTRIAARFAEAGLSTLAFVDRAPDTVDGVIRILQNDIEQRHGTERAEAAAARVRELLDAAGATADGFYNQLILFRGGAIEAAVGSDVFGLSAPSEGK